MIISQNSNDVYYAYTRGRFWRWDGSAQVWKESHLLAQKFDKAKAAEKHLTPEAFLTGDEFIPMDDYELPQSMLTALRDAKPCKNAPIDPVEEDSSSGVPAPCICSTCTCGGCKEECFGNCHSCGHPVQECNSYQTEGEKHLHPAHSADVTEPVGNIPAAPSFDFSPLGDLAGAAADADQQFDLHYGTAQDEYLVSCIYLARIHALTAKAGRYGGGTWTKWYESKGLSHGSVTKMVQNGEAFNSSTVDELKQLPNLTRKDLNLIARSGCADQVVAAAGDGQRVQDLLTQLKAEKDRADAAERSAQNARKENAYFKELVKSAEAQTSKDAERREEAESRYESALADISGLKEQNAKLQQSYHDADESRIAANLQRQKAEAERDRAEARAKDAENQLAGSRQVAEAAKLRGDKLKAENDALKSQPITAVVDKEETRRQAKEMAAEMTAELQAKLDAVTGDAEQDARNAYDSVLLASRAMLNTWQMVKPQFCKLPKAQRETLANQIVSINGQINGEVAQCL
nr:MAG TPA: STOP protein [Caudoviricetes sp.]